MGAIATERGLYLCNQCQRQFPFSEFLERGLISGARHWICGDCNECPDCGQKLRTRDGRGVHQCRVPVLIAALGVELTTSEQKLIRWIASSIDAFETETLAALFLRARGALTETAEPDSGDPWAEFDGIFWEVNDNVLDS